MNPIGEYEKNEEFTTKDDALRYIAEFPTACDRQGAMDASAK